METPSYSRCPETNAMIFTTPKHILEIQGSVKQIDELKDENAKLRALVNALVEAQPASVKAKLPQDLLE